MYIVGFIYVCRCLKLWKSSGVNMGKPFTLTHCWMKIAECPKWKAQYVAPKKAGASSVINPTKKRPRRKTNSKVDASMMVQHSPCKKL